MSINDNLLLVPLLLDLVLFLDSLLDLDILSLFSLDGDDPLVKLVQQMGELSVNLIHQVGEVGSSLVVDTLEEDY